MLPGTIVMLLFIIIVIFGGAGWLLKLNLQSESKKNLQGNESPTEAK